MKYRYILYTVLNLILYPKEAASLNIPIRVMLTLSGRNLQIYNVL